MISRGQQIVRRSLKNWGRVEIGNQTIERLLYSHEKDKDRKIETAFIEHRNDFLLVWRPISEPPSKWRPLYELRMTRDSTPRIVLPLRKTVTVEGVSLKLPQAELTIDPELRKHLSNLKAEPK
ncbi:hypothetical protein [Thalassospira sp. MIT1370]|uniref:hypothetical protein n=1 Tax=unclassified Thalassospira TaxID=2648997 RepID=UPI00399B03C9